MLTEYQAIEIAKKEFAKHGHTVSEYAIKFESYHADANQWIVWFERAGPFPIPGGKSAVLVHKTTGSAEFLPGE